MRLLLINPNTTQSMTAAMAKAGAQVLAKDTELVDMTAGYGPESIEGYYDEALSVPPILELIATYHGRVDGAVIGCFDDTGVEAARTITDMPVIGICQAAMQAAATLAGSFSVITTLGRSVPALEHLALRYGYERACKRVRACEVPVLALEQDDGGASGRIRAEIEAALRDDRSEAIVLGCAGMASFADTLSQEFGVPVIEGVTVALKWVEALACLGLKTSSRGGYAPPRLKYYKTL